MSTSRIARRWARGALLAVALGVGPAQARDSAYCRKVHALAATNASLLLWPKVTAEAVRYPFLDQAGGPTVLDTGIQLRLGLALSPTDMVQGARLDAAAEADCRLHEATESLKRVLAEAGDRAALAALQDQATFLLAHREEWKGLLAHGEGRRAAGVITIVEMEALRRLASQLERALAHAQGEAGRLERQLRRATAPVSLSAVSHRYVEAAMDLERQTVASPPSTRSASRCPAASSRASAGPPSGSAWSPSTTSWEASSRRRPPGGTWRPGGRSWSTRTTSCPPSWRSCGATSRPAWTAPGASWRSSTGSWPPPR